MKTRWKREANPRMMLKKEMGERKPMARKSNSQQAIRLARRMVISFQAIVKKMETKKAIKLKIQVII